MCSDRKSGSVEEYLRKLSGQEKESLGNSVDHNYVRPWYATTESQRTKPAKLLFMNSIQKPKSTYAYPDEEIDVVINSENQVSQTLFDSPKTKVLSFELERCLKCSPHIKEDSSDLDDLPIENFSYQKREMYKEVMELINADILAKVAYSGKPHEFIKRKVVTEKCGRKLRMLFANAFYDFDIILWIHKLILDKGNLSSVASYLNILQALSLKIPTIVDKILKSYSGPFGYEYLCQLLKKQWDPVPVLNQHKLRKLPGSPYLLMCCAGFNATKAMDKSPRFKFWLTNLNSLCKTTYIPSDCYSNSTYQDTIDSAFIMLTNKIIESKNHFPKRPVVLAGWGTGALIACRVALKAAVDAIICFGFPLTGVNGSQCGWDDPLLEIKVPILYVIGQNSNMCSTDDIEDFRSRIPVESSLTIVGGADDFLCVSPQKMQLEGITQEIVDRCILDEISDFLQSTLVKMPPAQFSLKKGVDDGEDLSYNDQSKKKRKKSNYSPEKAPSPKRLKIVVPKETVETFKPPPAVPVKKSKQAAKKAKEETSKVEDKRSPIKPLRIKIPKPIVASRMEQYKAAEEAMLKSKLAELEELTPKPVVRKLPFALNILPKKNEPVDVLAAFGNDCNFLPQLFDDPPPEDSSALDVALPAAATPTPNVTEPVARSSFTSENITELENAKASDLISEIASVPSSVEPSTPLLELPSTSKDTFALPAPPPPSVAGSTLNIASASKPGISVFASPSVFKTVTKEDNKILTATSVGQLKNIVGEKASSSFSQASSSGVRKSIITVPSTAATLLFSGKTLKTPSGKFLQVLTKGSIPIKAKPELTPQLIRSSRPMESVVPSGSNLSLLSNTNPIVIDPSANLQKKPETNSSATLVKLAALPSVQNFKQVPKFRSSPVSSFPMKAETPAEMAEKQRAIMELNKSLNLDTSSVGHTVTSASHMATSANKISESGYTICYTKPDGSIISRKIIRPPVLSSVRHANPFM